MKLGQLADMLTELAEAEAAVEKARLSLGYGGSPSTMEGKRSSLEYCQSEVERLRDQDLPA